MSRGSVLSILYHTDMAQGFEFVVRVLTGRLFLALFSSFFD